MNYREQYEEDLRRRQAEHLRHVTEQPFGGQWSLCAHDQCQACIGTGVKSDGSPCVHSLYCSCPRCSPR